MGGLKMALFLDNMMNYQFKRILCFKTLNRYVGTVVSHEILNLHEIPNMIA